MNQKTSPTEVMPAKACLADFFLKTKSLEAVASFTNINQTQTVKRWLQDITPEGERSIRLNCFLVLMGYTVAEVERVDPLMRLAAMYLSLDVITIENMAKGIGAGEPKRIFEYIRGRNGISAERGQRLQKMLDDNAAPFEKKKTAMLSKLAEVIKIVCTDILTPEDLIAQFEASCLELRRLGKLLLAGSPEMRFAMREKIGQGREPLLHTTWETLNKLLAERKELH
jgi:hypothetical protein